MALRSAAGRPLNFAQAAAAVGNRSDSPARPRPRSVPALATHRPAAMMAVQALQPKEALQMAVLLAVGALPKGTQASQAVTQACRYLMCMVATLDEELAVVKYGIFNCTIFTLCYDYVKVLAMLSGRPVPRSADVKMRADTEYIAEVKKALSATHPDHVSFFELSGGGNKMVTLHGVQLLEDSAYAITEHATRIGQGLAQAADALGRKAVEELRVFANDLGLTEIRGHVSCLARLLTKPGAVLALLARVIHELPETLTPARIHGQHYNTAGGAGFGVQQRQKFTKMAIAQAQRTMSSMDLGVYSWPPVAVAPTAATQVPEDAFTGSSVGAETSTEGTSAEMHDAGGQGDMPAPAAAAEPQAVKQPVSAAVPADTPMPSPVQVAPPAPAMPPQHPSPAYNILPVPVPSHLLHWFQEGQANQLLHAALAAALSGGAAAPALLPASTPAPGYLPTTWQNLGGTMPGFGAPTVGAEALLLAQLQLQQQYESALASLALPPQFSAPLTSAAAAGGGVPFAMSMPAACTVPTPVPAPVPTPPPPSQLPTPPAPAHHGGRQLSALPLGALPGCLLTPGL